MRGSGGLAEVGRWLEAVAETAGAVVVGSKGCGLGCLFSPEANSRDSASISSSALFVTAEGTAEGKDAEAGAEVDGVAVRLGLTDDVVVLASAVEISGREEEAVAVVGSVVPVALEDIDG